jgi:anti-sigma regulatory factor (Ser/Thr protein kinase)
VAILAVRHTPASAAIVRQKLTDALQQAGLTADQAYDAALIATELVGNAVLHGRPLPSGDITVEWQLSADGYYIAVTDGGHSAAVAAKDADSRDVSGRGLMIVAALSQEWGVLNTGAGTKVWAQASLAPKGAPAGSPLRSTCHA